MSLLSNPVLAKELRSRIRGARALIILSIYLVLTSMITLLVYLAMTASISDGFNDFDAGPRIGKAIFLTVMTAALVQVAIITPSLTAGAISGEKERQSYDLLITTMLSPLQIAIGKLIAALAFAMLLIVGALPLAALSFLFGGVSGTELAIGIVGLIMTAIFYATVGMFWSTIMRTTLGATVMAQGSIILKLLGIPFIFVIITLIGSQAIDDPGPLFIYAIGTLLCLHPFIALGLTEAALLEGESAFFLEIPAQGMDILVPSPWIAYLFIAIAFTAMLIFLSVRMLKPVQYGLPKAQSDKTR